MFARRIKRLSKTLRREVGCADSAHLARCDELFIGSQYILEGCFRIIPVGLIKIDIVGLRPLEGGVDGFADIAGRKAFFVRPHF
ncbi:hypothetical protein FQZ97_889770 [compost metagenome]